MLVSAPACAILARVRRGRLTGVVIGLVVVLINIGVVLAVVFGLEGPPTANRSSTSSTSTDIDPAPTTTSSTSSKSSSPRSVIARRDNPSIVVLGGDEGVGDSGWVSGLSSVVAERGRSVSFASLSPQDPTKYGDSALAGEGDRLNLWNASVSSSSLSYATNRVRFLVPETTDVVLISYQPTRSAGLARQLDDLTEEVRSQSPRAAVAVVVGPRPADGSRGEVRRAQKKWAQDHGVEVIDVDSAFQRSPDGVLLDPTSPSGLSAPGAQVWAAAVADSLLGRAAQTDTSEAEPTQTAPAETPETASSTTTTTTSPPPVPDPVTTQPPAPPPVDPPPAPSPTYTPPPTRTSESSSSDGPSTSTSSTEPSDGDPSSTEETTSTSSSVSSAEMTTDREQTAP